MLYTPTMEHFGIVPIEAMSLGVPVIAINNGGPRETIKNGETGYLCEDMSKDWANKMAQLVIFI